MTPGTTFIYYGSKDGLPELNTVHITDETRIILDETRIILGVPCLVVHDTVIVGGQLAEFTIDWYRQDGPGNVWYCREFATDFENGHIIGHGGSWMGGVIGAQEGIVMEAHPHVGDTYRQEYLPGVAEDMARVLSLTESVCVPYGCFQGNVLMTEEWSPLEPGVVKHKWYAPGVGNVKTVMVQGGTDHSELVAIEEER